MMKLVITRILNNQGQPVCTYYYNKPIIKYVIEIGKDLKIKYEHSGSFTHETVEDIVEDEYGFWVKTTKKMWRFDYVYEKNDEKVVDIE